jgi:hypothetical protein
MFTLKVIDDEILGLMRSDTEHMYGGTDMLQQHAFHHLFPSGACPWPFRELLYALAELHGWEVQVRTIKNTEKSESSNNETT